MTREYGRMKITTLDRAVSDILKEFLFIPRFQRPYSWEKEQVEQFWQDTILENSSDYFIGSIVLYKQGNEFGIVDGQQRITTILLLLAALRNALREQKLPDLAGALQVIIERTDVDAKKRYVLHTETSFPFLQDKILRDGPPQIPGEPTAPEEKLLNDMFQVIKEKIDDAITKWPTQADAKGAKAESVLRTIRDRLLGLKLITVQLESDDDAYLVFETLNTRGKDLEVSDLVKNHLSRLMKADNKALDALKYKWAQILGTFSSTDAEVDVDSFIHHFWLSRSAEYVTAKKVFASFKKATVAGNASATLDDLVKDATVYRQLAEPTYGKWKKEDGNIRVSLAAISSTFRMRQPYPLLLAVLRCYRDGALTKKNVEATLWVIERFHFQFTAVAQKSSSGGISMMYASWAQRLTNAKTDAARQAVLGDIKKNLKQRMPTKDDFVAGFMQLRYSDEFTRQKKLVKYILARIEDHLSNTGVAIDFDKMTIEHVAPQNPQPGAAQKISSDHVAMLGNLLLGDEKLQNDLQNHGFEKKKQVLKASGLGAAKAITAKSAWTQAAIEQRTQDLAELAYSTIWKA